VKSVEYKPKGGRCGICQVDIKRGASYIRGKNGGKRETSMTAKRSNAWEEKATTNVGKDSKPYSGRA